jgi:putative ABC transport system permease protein
MNLRASFRSVWRDKTFAAMTLLLLTLGIGACTAIFTIVNSVLIRPIPYANPDRIVTVWTQGTKTGRVGQISAPDFKDFQQQSQSFRALAAFSTDLTNVSTAGTAERNTIAVVSAGFFDALGVRPELGRLLTDDEASTPGRQLAVISHDFWQRRLAASPQAIGQSVRIDNKNYEMIGVLPAGFHYPDGTADTNGPTDVWLPAANAIASSTSRTAHNFRAVARLRDGVSVQAADAELKTIASRLATQYPEDANKSAAIIPLQDYSVRNVKQTLQVLLAAVLVLLAIACANVANLLLARVMRRRRELAVRTALGASRWDILRELLAESLALSIPAGLTGLLLGSWAAQLAVRFAPSDLPRTANVSMDWRVGAFAFLIAILSSVLFTLIPAVHSLKSSVADALHLGGSYSVVGGGSRKIRGFLVVFELGATLSLLFAAVLLLRSLSALLGTDPGYNPNGILAVRMSVPAANTEEELRAVNFFTTLLERAQSSPDIQSVSATNTLPNMSSSNGRYLIEGRPAPAPGDFSIQQAGFIVEAPNYFSLLGIGIKQGRDFGPGDTEASEPTCIINEALARQSFPGGNAIGHRLQTGMDVKQDFMTIVGVVADVRQFALDRPPQPIIYMPYPQHPMRAASMTLLVRPRTSTDAAANSVMRLTRDLAPDIALDFAPLTTFSQTTAAAPRYRTMLFSVFSGMALLLAAIGLYGLMSYNVIQRRREMGVRMALGAHRRHVFTLIMREGGGLIAVGVAVGIPLALLTSKLLQSFVYGITLKDPATFIAAVALLATAGLAAAYVPARRATRVELAEVLRQE